MIRFLLGHQVCLFQPRPGRSASVKQRLFWFTKSFFSYLIWQFYNKEAYYKNEASLTLLQINQTILSGLILLMIPLSGSEKRDWSAEHHITSLQLSFGHRHLKTLKINQNARNIHICLSLGFGISNAFSRFKNNTYRWFELFYKSFDFLPWQPRFFLSCLQ